MGFTTILTGRGARTVIVDTFPFISDDVSAWPPGGGLGFSFNSSNRIVGADPAMNYHIAPNSPANGVTPNRQFSTQLDESIVPERIQQTVNNTVDINVYDMRWGGRSWLPLYGLGRLGVSLGFAFMPAYYKITENRNYLALGPNTPGEVLASVSSEHLDWRPHYGGFAGADLSLGVGPVYVNASADYTWATHQMYRLDFVETSFSPGGMSASAGVGVRF